MKYLGIVGGVFLAGIIAIIALYRLEFFGLFRPDEELARWAAPPDPSLAEPVGEPFGLTDLEAMAARVDDRLRGLFAEGPPAYTLEQAEAWASQVTPLVEDASGRTFAMPPVIRLGDRAAIAAVLEQSLLNQYREAAAWLEGSGLDRMAAEYGTILSASLLGLYDFDAKAIILAPTNVRAAMRAAEIDEQHFEPLVKLVIAHELTHALQDQEIDIGGSAPSPTDGERLVAFLATIEGHAQLVQDMVGERLGLSDSVLELGRMMSTGAITRDDPEFDLVLSGAEVSHEEVYFGGRDFMAYHYKDHGPERLWEILAAPPANLSVINRPAVYGATGPRLADYYMVLKGLEEYFGEGWTNEHNRWVSPAELHGWYAGLARNARERVVGSIEHVQMLSTIPYPPSHDQARAIIYLIVLRNESDVEPFMGARDRSSDETWDAAEPVPGVVADESRRWEADYDDASGKIIEYGGGFARRGRVIADVRWTEHRMIDEDLAELINAIFERFDEIVAPKYE